MVKKEKVQIVKNLAGGKGEAKVYNIASLEELHGAAKLYAKVVLPPGASVGWHQHKGETEPYYILSGEGTFIDNDKSKTTVTKGDICVINDGDHHSIENNSNADLEFMALIYNLIK